MAGSWEILSRLEMRRAARTTTAVHTSQNPKALAAIYASLVLPRQGFMFGMIYGALLCEKAGVSMDAYVEQLPLTIKVVHDYYDLFAATVPSGDFADPPASLGIFYAAFQDVLNTCRDLGTPDELPRLLHDLLKRGVDAGLNRRLIARYVDRCAGRPRCRGL